jgi:hypothetical protein
MEGYCHATYYHHSITLYIITLHDMHRIKEKGLHMMFIGTIYTEVCLDRGYAPLNLVLVDLLEPLVPPSPPSE